MLATAAGIKLSAAFRIYGFAPCRVLMYLLLSNKV
nr:MAG TPA: hypothetical protein [Caudoviricetes sp.]